MRRLCLILLACLVAAPAAYAATRATGDGVLELRAVDGTVVVNGTRGSLWGQMDKGKLVATDLIPGDGQILVSGAGFVKPSLTDPNTTTYRGTIHFRVTGGRYKLVFKGTSIDLTAVGVGTAQLTGDVLSNDPGDYAVDGGKWIPVLFAPRFVQFGVQPVTVGGPSPSP